MFFLSNSSQKVTFIVQVTLP